MKNFLKKLIENKEKEVENVRARIKDSTDVEEVRALGATLENVLNELSDAKDQLAKMEEEEQKSKEGAGAGEGEGEGEGEGRSFKPLATYEQRENKKMNKKENNVYGSMEYRQAFKDYVQSGIKAPILEKRADAATTSTDIGAIIPTTIMDEVIKEVKVYGQLYKRVRKLNVPGGVEFPISELAATATWVAESTGYSDRKDAGDFDTKVSFSYFLLELKLAQTLIATVVSLDVFEKEITEILVEAFAKALDTAILAGTGNGQPTGITVDSRVPADHKITFTAAEMAAWANWRTKLFAKIPLAKRGKGVLVMTSGTWEADIMTMKDDQNRPLYQETYNPVTGELECRFNGREVILVESDMLEDFQTATDGKVFAVYLPLNDYAINSNLQFSMKRYFDEDKNQWVNKGLAILDGKLLDTKGVFILKKSVPASV